MTRPSFLNRFTLSFFFFSSRRRHTRWPRDWSSDVCLPICGAGIFDSRRCSVIYLLLILAGDAGVPWLARNPGAAPPADPGDRQIGRASCRETVEGRAGVGSWRKKAEAVEDEAA